MCDVIIILFIPNKCYNQILTINEDIFISKDKKDKNENIKKYKNNSLQKIFYVI